MMRGELLEAIAEGPPLSRRVLEQHHRLAARPRLEGRRTPAATSRSASSLAAGSAGARDG